MYDRLFIYSLVDFIWDFIVTTGKSSRIISCLFDNELGKTILTAHPLWTRSALSMCYVTDLLVPSMNGVKVMRLKVFCLNLFKLTCDVLGKPSLCGMFPLRILCLNLPRLVA